MIKTISLTRRKRIIKVLTLLLLAGVGTGCKKEMKDPKPAEARALFESTCELTRSYIDSIKIAKDTAMLHQLITNFEERIDNLNMSSAPDIDYSLTEGENDTIMQLLDRLSAARAERLKALASKTDSITTPSESKTE